MRRIPLNVNSNTDTDTNTNTNGSESKTRWTWTGGSPSGIPVWEQEAVPAAEFSSDAFPLQRFSLSGGVEKVDKK